MTGLDAQARAMNPGDLHGLTGLHRGVALEFGGPFLAVDEHPAGGWLIEAPDHVSCWGTSKLECIDQLIIMLAKRIEDAKAVKDRLEREFMVEFERSKK